MTSEVVPRRSGRWLWIVAVCFVLLSGFSFWYFFRGNRIPAHPSSIVPVVDAHTSAVSCLGRVEPEDGVLHVSGPVLNPPHPPVVESLKVKQGDYIHRGDLIATFVGRAQLAAAVERAKSEENVARMRLNQLKAGAKEQDIQAQQAEIARLQASLDNANKELKRIEALRATGDATASEVDAGRTQVEVLRHSVDEAQFHLESLKNVPAHEIDVAEAELAESEATERQARSDYDQTTLYSPSDGEVLRVNSHAGEEVGTAGIIELGRTERMVVVAEVYESDINRVHLGERATISGDLLTEPLDGKVIRIGHTVKESAVLPGDTAAFSDNRIIEARILLDRGAAVAGLINGKVTVVFQP